MNTDKYSYKYTHTDVMGVLKLYRAHTALLLHLVVSSICRHGTPLVRAGGEGGPTPHVMAGSSVPPSARFSRRVQSTSGRHVVLGAVALGTLAGALVALTENTRGAAEGTDGGEVGSSEGDLGWLPPRVRAASDPAVKLAYRREVIAAAALEWRAAASGLGYADRFDLDAGPLGGGEAMAAFNAAVGDGKGAGSGSGSGSGVGAGEWARGYGGGRGAVLDDSSSVAALGIPHGGALWFHPEPAMPADVDVDESLRGLILKTRSKDKGEVMLGLANGVMICQNTKICWWNGGNILQSFLEVTWKKLGVRNLILAILDDETDAYMKAKWPDVPTFRPNMEIPSAQDGSHPANRVSTLKYDLLRKFIATGTGVLITDLDLVYVENPFPHLHRDADIEGQTDGFTLEWAHGHLSGITDKSMGWGGGGLYAQVFTINVGCMYVRPTARAAALMARVAKRLASSPGWDQQVFNEEAILPAHGETTSGLVTIRILDYMRFVNTKTFFKSQRRAFLPGSKDMVKPVMIHSNYHPDKHRRMQCLIARYHEGKQSACDHLPGGSEPGT